MSQRKTVLEYESVMPTGYEVVVRFHDSQGQPQYRYLGTRSRDGRYLRPKFTPAGELLPFAKRIYTNPPAWLNYPVDTAIFPPDRNIARLVIRQEDLPK